MVLTAEHPDLATPWPVGQWSDFYRIASTIGVVAEAFFQEQDLVQDNWLTEIKTAAQTYVARWQADKS